MEHRIFGTKEAVEYFDRKGAYIIPFDGSKVAVTKAKKGYYLIGGGLQEGESDAEGIVREAMEETGCKVEIKEMICSGETYCKIDSIGYYHPIQNYYLGELKEKVTEPVEDDHYMLWLDVEEALSGMVIEMQAWAIREGHKRYLKNTI